jgi:hypothetical protein
MKSFLEYIVPFEECEQKCLFTKLNHFYFEVGEPQERVSTMDYFVEPTEDYLYFWKLSPNGIKLEMEVVFSWDEIEEFSDTGIANPFLLNMKLKSGEEIKGTYIKGKSSKEFLRHVKNLTLLAS